MKAVLVPVLLALSGLSASAQTPPAPKPHAMPLIARVVTAPVVHPKRTLKQVLGSALFATESVVDVAHDGLSLADKAFDALGVAGKVPVVDAVYAVVSIGATDSGKLDLWLERQETFLFGTHN